jgi:hypothetical protein
VAGCWHWDNAASGSVKRREVLTAFSRRTLLLGVSYLVGSLGWAVYGRDSERYH